jgi:FdhD protein
MSDEIEGLPALRITDGGKSESEEMIAREFPLTIIFNNQELVTLLCSPTNLNYLAVGFLASEGLITGKDEIKRIMLDSQRGVVRVETGEDKELAPNFLFKRFITSGCGRGASFYGAADAASLTKVESQTQISAQVIFALMKEFQHRSQVYRVTHGVHSAALCDTSRILIFSEDIARHNAIDKILGECILENIETEGQIIMTSGRVSSEILLKAAKRNIPIIISKAAPTNLAVKLAADLGVTLIGFVRGRRMNVYAGGWRVITDEK